MRSAHLCHRQRTSVPLIVHFCAISEALVFLFVVDFALFADDRAVLLFHFQPFGIFAELCLMTLAGNKVFFDIPPRSGFQPLLSGADDFYGTGIFLFIIPYTVQAGTYFGTVERDLCSQLSSVVVQIPDIYIG